MIAHGFDDQATYLLFAHWVCLPMEDFTPKMPNLGAQGNGDERLNLVDFFLMGKRIRRTYAFAHVCGKDEKVMRETERERESTNLALFPSKPESPASPIDETALSSPHQGSSNVPLAQERRSGRGSQGGWGLSSFPGSCCSG